MSGTVKYTTEVVISCDHSGCGRKVHLTTVTSTPPREPAWLLSNDARTAAQRQGWIVERGGRPAHCPTHKAEAPTPRRWSAW